MCELYNAFNGISHNDCKLLAFFHNRCDFLSDDLVKFSRQRSKQTQIKIKGALAIRRIFSLVDMITKPKFSNCPNVFKIGLFR